MIHMFRKFAAQEPTTPHQDYVSSAPIDTVVGAAVPLGPVGAILGAVGQAPTKSQLIAQSVPHPTDAIIPARGDYKLGRRRSAVARAVGAQKRRIATELAGQITGGVIGSGLGLYSGYKVSDALGLQEGFLRHVAPIIGASVGYGVPMVLGAIAAGLSRKRTMRQQAAYEHTKSYLPDALNLMVPGAAYYNYYKGVGASQHITNPKTANINDVLRKVDTGRSLAREMVNADERMSASQDIGSLTGRLVGAGVGAGVGLLASTLLRDHKKYSDAQQQGMADFKNKGIMLTSMLSGASAGVVLPVITAFALNAVKRRRTLQQQAAYEHSGTNQMATNMFVPGMSSYNYWRSVGAARQVVQDHIKNKYKKMPEPLQRAMETDNGLENKTYSSMPYGTPQQDSQSA